MILKCKCMLEYFFMQELLWPWNKRGYWHQDNRSGNFKMLTHFWFLGVTSNSLCFAETGLYMLLTSINICVRCKNTLLNLIFCSYGEQAVTHHVETWACVLYSSKIVRVLLFRILASPPLKNQPNVASNNDLLDSSFCLSLFHCHMTVLLCTKWAQ